MMRKIELRGRGSRWSAAWWAVLLALAALAVLGVTPVRAQIQSVDPDAAIDADLNQGQPYNPPVSSPPATPSTATPAMGNGTPVDSWSSDSVTSDPAATQAATPQQPVQTYRKDDLMGAAEGVFGKGAEGLASIIEDLLKKQGEPNGYIVGREASAAIAVGLRYGSGTLHHKIEGDHPVYWTGPSLGFDLGANAGKAFVLVYNLYDSDDLYHRFGAGEGQAYLVGGFHISYLRRGDVVLIPVRMGAGLRLGANVGYMKFSREQNWVPF